MRRKLNPKEYMRRNKTYRVETKERTVVGVMNHLSTDHDTLSMFEQGTFEECKFPTEDILKITEVGH